jgi:hypothetical protein
VPYVLPEGEHSWFGVEDLLQVALKTGWEAAYSRPLTTSVSYAGKDRGIHLEVPQNAVMLEETEAQGVLEIQAAWSLDVVAILEEAVIREESTIAQDTDAQLQVGILAEGLEEVGISPAVDTPWDFGALLETEIQHAVGCGLLAGESWEAEVLDQVETQHVADNLSDL